MVKMASSCLKCGSNQMKIHDPQAKLWECSKCGYTGYIAIEDDNLEKKIKEAKKMEKLSKKIMKGR